MVSELLHLHGRFNDLQFIGMTIQLQNDLYYL